MPVGLLVESDNGHPRKRTDLTWSAIDVRIIVQAGIPSPWAGDSVLVHGDMNHAPGWMSDQAFRPEELGRRHKTGGPVFDDNMSAGR